MKGPAGGHAVVLRRENYGQVKWCLSEQPFFSFFYGVRRPTSSILILCKTDKPGQGDGAQDGVGDSRQKRLQRSGAVHVVPQ